MVVSAAAAARPRFPRSFRLRKASVVLVASAAWRGVRVQALAASLWPPRVLALVLAASPSKRPRAALVVVLMPRERAQPLAVASTRALVLLPGPFLSVHCCFAAPVPGSTV